MKSCAFCGYANEDVVQSCVKCGTSLESLPKIEIRTLRFGPYKAHDLRKKAIGFFVVGLMIKVYWGGYGTWEPYDTDLLMNVRTWIQPALLYGGAITYAVGWVLNWI
jgi:hypothetical protein